MCTFFFIIGYVKSELNNLSIGMFDFDNRKRYFADTKCVFIYGVLVQCMKICNYCIE